MPEEVESLPGYSQVMKKNGETSESSTVNNVALKSSYDKQKLVNLLPKLKAYSSENETPNPGYFGRIMSAAGTRIITSQFWVRPIVQGNWES